MTTDSQCTKILRWLAMGRTLTTWQAWSKWKITTASQRVTELKKRRWPIECEMVQRGKHRIAMYSIPRARDRRRALGAS